jgi:hypothetical protein
MDREGKKAICLQLWKGPNWSWSCKTDCSTRAVVACRLLCSTCVRVTTSENASLPELFYHAYNIQHPPNARH